jgi:hypothetical protein
MARRKHKKTISDALRVEGWNTPNSYGTDYLCLPDGPGIYILLVYENGCFDPSPFVGYVGKSLRLCRRLACHPMLPVIEAEVPKAYIQKWFIGLPKEAIGQAEIDAIKRFNPPYNIQYRIVRGLKAA